MINRCFQCGAEIVELAADDPARRSSDYGYAPAFVVEVLPTWKVGEEDGACRATVICWSCMHVLELDAWFSQQGWDANRPAVLFVDLPMYNHNGADRDDYRTYVLGADEPKLT